MSAALQVVNMRPEPPRRSTLSEIEDELERLVYRAKFYADPITIEAVEKIVHEIRTMVDDGFEASGILADIRNLVS